MSKKKTSNKELKEKYSKYRIETLRKMLENKEDGRDCLKEEISQIKRIIKKKEVKPNSSQN